jgi:hypothetical protein
MAGEVEEGKRIKRHVGSRNMCIKFARIHQQHAAARCICNKLLLRKPSVGQDKALRRSHFWTSDEASFGHRDFILLGVVRIC